MGGDKNGLTQTLKGLWVVTALAILCAATFCICINTAYADEASINADNEISFESEDETFAPALQTMALQEADDVKVGIKVQLYDKQVYSKTEKKATPQGGCSFSGARIDIEAAGSGVDINGRHYNSGDTIETLVTSSSGTAQSSSKKYTKGTYRAVMRTLPRTYYKDGYQYVYLESSFSITDDDKDTDYVDIDPDGKFGLNAERGGVIVVFHDEESLLAKPQGDALLSYASFSVKNLNSNAVYYYYYRDQSTGAGQQLSLRLSTDASGAAYTENDALPRGRYEIIPDSGSTGYRDPDAEPIEFEIGSNGQMALVDVYGAVERGGFSIQTEGVDNDEGLPIGAASLKGAKFQVRYWYQPSYDDGKYVYVDGVRYDEDAVCYTFETDEEGKFTSAPDLLPYGAYQIEQISGGEGYVLCEGEDPPDDDYYYEPEVDEALRFFEIDEDGEIVTEGGVSEYMETYRDLVWQNRVMRADLEFTKKDPSGKALPGVPFKLTSQTTGESHIIVTDSNGYLNTAASWNPHTQRTNANDDVEDGVYDKEAGVWFGRYGEDQMTEASDEYGALPYDHYTLTELPCEANEGLKLVEIPDIVVERDGVTINYGIIIDEAKTPVVIDTTATDGLDGDKIIAASHQSTIEDTVSYSGLEPGETYRLESKLIDAKSGEPFKIEGEEVTQSTEFSPDESTGEEKVTFMIDATGLAEDMNVNVFESLYKGEELIAKHEDTADADQTVTIGVPAITTTAHGEDKASKKVEIGEKSKIVDTVSYSNLLPDETYKLTATLYSKSRRAPAYNGLDPITASVEFSPTESSGSVDVPIIFDATDLDDEELVVAEVLTKGTDRIAEHASVDDENQTVTLVEPDDPQEPAEPSTPTMTTVATDRLDGDKMLAAGAVAIVDDQVHLEGLQADARYKLVGTLYEKSTGEPLEVDNGNTTASAVFTANGDVQDETVSFSFDTAGLNGQDIVVCEELFIGGEDPFVYDTLAASHKDLNDADQTVTVDDPTLTTVAVDESDGDKELEATSGVTIKDTVTYENLSPGKAYELNGTLTDGDTGEPLLIDGNKVVALFMFTPKDPSGQVDMTFRFDATGLEDKRIVVFESLSSLMQPIAEHADINDEAQTVTVKDELPEVVEPPQDDDLPDGGGPAQTDPAPIKMPTEQTSTSNPPETLIDAGTPYAQTGVGPTWPVWIAILLGILAGGSVVAYAIWRWRSERHHENDSEIEQ